MSAPAVLVRTGRAEWARLWTVRSTWFLVGTVVLAVLGLGLLAGIDASRGVGELTDAWDAARFTTMFALFGVTALAVVATASDYSTGGIVPTLQWTPRRGVLLLARAGVVGATCVGLGVVLVGGASLLVAVLAPELGLPADGGLALAGDVATVLGGGALLAVGLALFLRSTAGALITVIALLLVLPGVLGSLPYDAAVTIASHLPGAAAIFLVFGQAPGETMTDSGARLTLLAWALGSLALGGWRLLRTDASR